MEDRYGVVNGRGVENGRGEAVPAETAHATLTVDLGTETGPFHGGAAGSLYGLYGDGVPGRNLVEGMALRTVSTKAQDGVQHPGADALEILPSFVAAGGRDVYVYVPDSYRGFPYIWPGADGPARLADLKERVRTQVAYAATLGTLRSHLVHVPFNEPEDNMFGTGQWSHDGVSWRTEPGPYFTAWRDVYRQIKGLDPGARVAGPNTCVLHPEVRDFLEFARDHDVLPDVVTWHELSSPAELRANVARYREMERELGIGPLPVNINEYAHNRHLSVPGRMIAWISAVEDCKIDADMAYWNIAGNLNDSTARARYGNGQWWLFNAYGRLTGTTVRVTAAHRGAEPALHGVATLDRDKGQARVLFGGTDGAARIVVAHAGLLGTAVRARLEEFPWTGQLGASAQPSLLLDTELPLVDGTVTLPVDALDEMSAYQLTLSPGGRGAPPLPPSVLWRRSYGAEDATPTGGGHRVFGPEGTSPDVSRSATSGDRYVGGLRTGSDLVLSFDVEVPGDGVYDLSVYAGSHNEAESVRESGPTNVFLRVDGARPEELLLPLGHQWAVWGRTDTRIGLTAGRHTLTLAAHDPELGATRGDAVLDRLTLALHPGTDAVYDAEHAVLGAGARIDRSGVALPPGGTVTFWVHAPADGEASVTVGRLGTGAGRLTVNDEETGDLRDGARALFLAGGVNKLTITGTSQPLIVDRLRIGPSLGRLPAVAHPAEEGLLTGTARVTGAHPNATGGKAVDGVGAGPANALTLTVAAVRAGRHALTLRYSNGEQAPATHYNADPVCRHTDLSVNGGAPQRVLFPTTYHFNDFAELSVPVTLGRGANTLTFTADVLPDFDGVIRNPYGQRSAYAPVLDRVTVTPLF